MNILKPHSIEELIISSLQTTTLSGVELIKIIETKRPGSTKQGIYSIIRKLKKDEIIVVHKKNISLSGVWLTSMENFFNKAQYSSKNTVSNTNTFLNLGQGEKLTYYFKNPILTDAFWSHVFITLVEASSRAIPILIYNPHEWFLLARTKNETDLFSIIKARGQKLALISGHSTPLDKAVRQYLDTTSLLYETLAEPLFDKNNYYINIFGDFLIEVWLDKTIAKNIDAFYKNRVSFGEKEKLELENILTQKGKNKFLITRNKRKTDAFRRKFKKYFFI